MGRGGRLAGRLSPLRRVVELQQQQQQQAVYLSHRQETSALIVSEPAVFAGSCQAQVVGFGSYSQTSYGGLQGKQSVRWWGDTSSPLLPSPPPCARPKQARWIGRKERDDKGGANRQGTGQVGWRRYSSNWLRWVDGQMHWPPKYGTWIQIIVEFRNFAFILQKPVMETQLLLTIEAKILNLILDWSFLLLAPI